MNMFVCYDWLWPWRFGCRLDPCKTLWEVWALGCPETQISAPGQSVCSLWGAMVWHFSCSQAQPCWAGGSDSSTGLCSPSASIISASHLIALGEENWAELRSILVEGSPLLLPAMHRRPLSLGMTPGPGAAAAALARSSPSSSAHPQPRGLFPAGGQGCDKSANAGVHPGLLVAINLYSWVSFEACSCFYCKIVVKNFMETNI